MHIANRWLARLGIVLSLATAAVLLVTWSSSASDGAQHVRWDLVSLVGGAPPGPLNPGGQASATAPNGGDTITLTGSGDFVAPGSGGGSSAATGGGTWETCSGALTQCSPATATASGTYTVTGLVSWVSAGPQSSTPAFIDNIDHGTRTNGTAVLRIAFSDGRDGVLTVGCHGPGAPPGIFEGIATTKGYTTYYTVQPPAGGVDANRTNFHVR
jgi:hypothetical protein